MRLICFFMEEKFETENLNNMPKINHLGNSNRGDSEILNSLVLEFSSDEGLSKAKTGQKLGLLHQLFKWRIQRKNS